MHVLLAAGSHAEVQGTAAGTEGLLVADGLWGQTSLLVAALDLHQTQGRTQNPSLTANTPGPLSPSRAQTADPGNTPSTVKRSEYW